MTTALGLLEGSSSTMFALALVLTLIVAYDATGVRLHAGAQLLSNMHRRLAAKCSVLECWLAAVQGCSAV
jgi:acid phosphatase family membrane protein YuiD